MLDHGLHDLEIGRMPLLQMLQNDGHVLMQEIHGMLQKNDDVQGRFQRQEEALHGNDDDEESYLLFHVEMPTKLALFEA